MKKAVVILILLIVTVLIFQLLNLTGNVVNEFEEEGFRGIPAEENKCMKDCVSVGCETGDRKCMTANSEKCMQECNIPQATPGNKEETCLQNCLDKFCTIGPAYTSCSNSHLSECEQECGMIKEPEAKNKEEKCIRECVSKHDPKIECKPGTSYDEDEKGNEICQECAKQCEHLYNGPCLTDEKWRQKEQECKSQGKHVDGNPIYGDSGEGYECVVDLKCKDYSEEFGNEPGEGPGIREKGYVASNPVTKTLDKAIKFFKELFKKESQEKQSVNIKNTNNAK